MAAWFGAATSHWYLPAIYRYAECLMTGAGGHKDVVRSVELYTQIVRYIDINPTEEDVQIRSEAAYCVAVTYVRGIGVELDVARAIKWFKKSAKLGCTEAMFELGLRSERGDGMRISPKIAMK